MDVGEEVEGAHDEQSSVSVGVGEDFHQVDEGCHGRGSAHRLEAHDAARTRNLSRRRAHHRLGCPPVEDRSSGFDAETEESRGAESVATDVEASAANRAWTRSHRGGERRGVTGVDGGSLCRDPVERSVEGRVSAIDLDPGDHREAFGQRGSR